MLYLVDSNVLIDANRDYYPMARVPEFWDWLLYLGATGAVKIPLEMHEELTSYEDELAAWIKEPATKGCLLLNEDVNPILVQTVLEKGYAPDLNDIEIEQIGKDPFLVAYALAAAGERCVVTTEGSRPSAKRANRRITDVCDGFGVPRCNTYRLLRQLNFSTGWNVILAQAKDDNERRPGAAA